MDQRNFSLLCRKLEALNYTDSLEPSSAPLVQKLVDDLVHTTESYRALKLKASKHEQEGEQWQGKLEVWKKDSQRLLHENNQLHVELIRQAERFDEDKKQHYLQSKRLEDRISELTFWKAQHVDRYSSLEEENARLREKIQDILGLSDHHRAPPRPAEDAAIIARQPKHG
uniref:Centrosomal protein of 135 kDa n=1 Tax=Tetraselmis sp. GSL018 TaxID=582737 RepID=A0A061RMJ2_9CHLO